MSGLRQSMGWIVCLTMLMSGCGGGDCDNPNPDYDPTDPASEACLSSVSGVDEQGAPNSLKTIVPCLEDVHCGGPGSGQGCSVRCLGDMPMCVSKGESGTSCQVDSDCSGTFAVCAQGVCFSDNDLFDVSVDIPSSDCVMPAGITASVGDGDLAVQMGSCSMADLGDRLSLSIGSSPDTYVFTKYTTALNTWSFNFTGLGVRTGGGTFQVESLDYLDVEQGGFYESCDFEISDNYQGESGLFEVIYVDENGSKYVGTEGTVTITNFEATRFQSCPGCRYDEPCGMAGSMQFTVQFTGVVAEEVYAPGDSSFPASEDSEDLGFGICSFSLEKTGKTVALGDGIFSFSGSSGAVQEPLCGPGNSTWACDPDVLVDSPYAGQTSNSSGGTSGTSGAATGNNTTPVDGSDTGSNAGSACDDFSDTTSYFGDIQFDSICWQAGVAQTCGLIPEAQQTCTSLQQFLEAVEANQGVGDCPYCK